MKVTFEPPNFDKVRKEINDKAAKALTEQMKDTVCPVHHKPATIKWRGPVDDPEFYAVTCCDKFVVDVNNK